MSDDAALRTAWATLAAEPPREPCPEPGAIFDAIQGRAPPADRAAIVDHLQVCGPCSEAWRIGMEVQAGAQAAAPEAAAPKGQLIPGPARWWASAAGVGLALAAALLLYVQPFGPTEDPWRAVGERGEAHATLANGAELPRDAFTVTWAGGVEHARYIVRISDSTLATLHESEPLGETRYTVPAEVLAAVSSGSVLYWQVETLSADGDRHRSATFDVRLR